MNAGCDQKEGAHIRLFFFFFLGEQGSTPETGVLKISILCNGPQGMPTKGILNFSYQPRLLDSQ